MVLWSRRRPSTRLIPLAFALPFAAVLVQFAIIGAGFGEPYPAIMMPDFRGTGGSRDGIVRIRVLEIVVTFLDGSVEHPTLATLLTPMPESVFAQVSLRNFRVTTPFPSGEQPRVGLKAWLVDHVTPIRSIRYRRRAAGNPPPPDTVQWLRDRLRLIYPGRQAQRIQFQWYSDGYRLSDLTLQRVEHLAAGSYPVELTP